jgi:hypothetical protein
MVAELPPQLLLPLGVGERGQVTSDPLYLGGVAGAGRRGLGTVPSAPYHHVALAQPHEGPLLGLWGRCGKLVHWSHPGGGESSSGISTTTAREPPAGAGPCVAPVDASARASVAAGA